MDKTIEEVSSNELFLLSLLFRTINIMLPVLALILYHVSVIFTAETGFGSPAKAGEDFGGNDGQTMHK